MSDDYAIHRATETLIAAFRTRYLREPRATFSSWQAATEYARALADAGLLAPAPLTEEWGVRYQDADEPAVATAPCEEWARGWASLPGDVVVRRHVTDWLPTGGVGRSEGGKSASDA
ncbi:MAG: hypothetical protein Q4F65_12580 [Propionibacteriaceae bacterium]|nr:hypothetical protein [Propionibacteriaceae bacterium]